MVVGACYAQRTVLAGFVFSVARGWGWMGYRAPRTSWLWSVCSEETP